LSSNSGVNCHQRSAWQTAASCAVSEKFSEEYHWASVRLFSRFDVVPQEGDFNQSPFGDVGNLMRAGYFKRVISVTTATGSEIVRSDSICPNSINAAHLEEEVLFGFSYARTRNPKLLFDWYRPTDFDIQSAFEKFLASGFSKHFGIFGHAFSEVPATLNNPSFEDYHDAAPFAASLT
jgi:hypothetical protein